MYLKLVFVEEMSKNVVLITGRAGSKSVIGKNVYPVLGRPLAYYPMFAAKQARLVDSIYISTDSAELQELAVQEGIKVIKRPTELAQDHSELIEAIEHAMSVIEEDIEYLITMHCNCGVHRQGLVDECIERMIANPMSDSCVSGYIDHSVHPFRTKRITVEGLLMPWLEVPRNTSSNRQSLDPCFILDGAVRVLRIDRCFPPVGQPPFSYLGNNIMYVENATGGDVHSLHDILSTENALVEMGWEKEY